MKPKSAREAVIVCVAGVVAVGLLVIPFTVPTHTADGATTNNTRYLFWIAIAGVVALGMMLGLRYLTVKKRAQIELASGEQYRRLADEYRRLADLAITTQEHTDLKLGDLSVQLDYLREQNASLQKILKDVE